MLRLAREPGGPGRGRRRPPGGPVPDLGRDHGTGAGRGRRPSRAARARRPALGRSVVAARAAAPGRDRGAAAGSPSSRPGAGTRSRPARSPRRPRPWRAGTRCGSTSAASRRPTRRTWSPRSPGTTCRPADRDLLARRTDGNPFFLVEYARLVQDTGGPVSPDELPAAVSDVLSRRLAGLPEESLAVLRAAAVLGREVRLPLLAARPRPGRGRGARRPRPRARRRARRRGGGRPVPVRARARAGRRLRHRADVPPGAAARAGRDGLGGPSRGSPGGRRGRPALAGGGAVGGGPRVAGRRRRGRAGAPRARARGGPRSAACRAGGPGDPIPRPGGSSATTS